MKAIRPQKCRILFYFKIDTVKLFRAPPAENISILPEILHAALEDLHILFAGNILRHRVSASLGMGHLSVHPSVGAGDAFDCHIRTVGIPIFVHGRIALLIYVLGRNLSVGKQSGQPLVGSDEASFSMGNRIDVNTAQFRLLEPRRLVGNHL